MVWRVKKKKVRTFAINTLLLILQRFKHCRPSRQSPLHWRYTVPNLSSIVGILPGTHFSVMARSSLIAFS